MSSDKNTITLSDLTLSQAHLELRTTPKYILWDRSGIIWSEMLDKYPRLSFVQSEPNRMVFSLDNKYVFSIYLDNTGTKPHTTILGSAHRPHPALKDFGDFLRTLESLAQDNLMITEYHRIGLRLIYFRDYPNTEAATEALLSTRLLTVPEGPFFNVKGLPSTSDYSVRIEEKDKKGVTIRLKTEGFTYDFNPPLEWHDVEPIHKRHNRLYYDVDQYVVGTVAVGQFNILEWLNQTLHVVQRDSDKFLRGV